MVASYSAYYTRERSRERSPYSLEDDSWSGALVRRDTQIRSHDLYDDDKYDDYPYPPKAKPAKPAKPSRALTIRRPSQAESKNIWSYSSSYDDAPRAYEESYDRKYKHLSKRYVSRPSHESDDDDKDNAYDIKIKATFRRPSSSKLERPDFWHGDLFKRKEKWEVTDWERTRGREHARRDSLFDDEPRLESTTRYRQMKRTKTEEFKPLSGFVRRW